jgi:adenine-specific DNA methylase
LTIEQDFDVPFVASMALREKQIQQNYRPIIAVHKWFARRPATLFRALLLSEFGVGSVRERFFEANSLKGRRVADPFMGGGTPLFEANRLGCDVVGYDINPMAYWIVRQEIEWLDLAAYQAAAGALVRALDRKVGHLYRTHCLHCSAEAPVKYFLWVKTLACTGCGRDVDLFPGYVLSEDRRHPRNVLVCASCGELTETDDRKAPGACGSCRKALSTEGPARRSQCACPACDTMNRYPAPERGAPRHRMFALEYHCHACKPGHQGRFFKVPAAEDLARYAQAGAMLARMRPSFIPRESIPPGDETDRLHRWGYRLYREMFNDRQLLGLETSARLIARQGDEHVRNALATNLSDLLRYQNMLCRYDDAVLKSLDIFSVHGFPVGLIQCESNLLGIVSGREAPNLFGDGEGGTNVGSGGWSNVIDKFTKAKAYCARPFEFRHDGRRKVQVPIPGEWIGDTRSDGTAADRREVALHCGSATAANLPPGSLDAVLTDPPYFSNVQYAELMDFCYVWLRRLVNGAEPAFRAATTRSADELTGNETMERGLGHFAGGLSEVFRRLARALKPGAPFVFTYHNNDLTAYHPVAVAILDAGLACTATLPCPAEMAASIHIAGTGSSVVDSIFVCRAAELPARSKAPAAPTPDEVADLVRHDCALLQQGGVEPTPGDVRCMMFGHLVRLAIRELRPTWDAGAAIEARLAAVGTWLHGFGGAATVEAALAGRPQRPKGTNAPPNGKVNSQRRTRRGVTDASLPI